MKKPHCVVCHISTGKKNKSRAGNEIPGPIFSAKVRKDKSYDQIARRREDSSTFAPEANCLQLRSASASEVAGAFGKKMHEQGNRPGGNAATRNRRRLFRIYLFRVPSRAQTARTTTEGNCIALHKKDRLDRILFPLYSVGNIRKNGGRYSQKYFEVTPHL